MNSTEKALNNVEYENNEIGSRQNVIPLPVRSKKPSSNELQKLDNKDKEIVLKLLSDVIISFIEQDCTVYIEKFGLLISKTESENIVSYCNEQAMVRLETSREIFFEKCIELTNYHRQRFPKIIEEKEISLQLYHRLPTFFQKKWDKNGLRKVVKEIFEELKIETINLGASNLLFPIGVFYALHNRQGNEFKDWLAGADVFLAPEYKQLISTDKNKAFTPAIFNSAWEPLQCTYGSPLHEFSIDIREEMRQLGYELPKGISPSIRTAIFEVKDNNKPCMLCCTDNLRNTSFNGSKPAGIEFTFQINCINNLDAIDLAARTFSLGWVLLNSTKSGTLKPGIGLNCQTPLTGLKSCKLNSIFTTQFSKIRHPANSLNGVFSYINLIWLTEAEADLLSKTSPDHLLTILKYKNLDQITTPNRSCILRKSSFSSMAKIYDRFLAPHPFC